MATGFPAHVSAVQVGTYFVRQYYHILQGQPEFVYQFYTDASTMLRIDGNKSELATAMMQIHSLIMSLNFTGVEIKTINSLDSLDRGVLVMVSGSVQTKEYPGSRNFVQTFFLAPQEKGYFVLNDIFHLLDGEQIHQHQAAILAQGHFDSTLSAPNPIPEPVSDYAIDGESQARTYLASTHVEENDSVDKYSLPEQQYSLPEQQQHVSEAEHVIEETPVEELTTSFSQVMNSVQESPPVHTLPPEEPVAEPQKHTYASILRVAKGPTASSATQRSTYKSAAPPAAQPTSEWDYPSQPTPQQSYPVSSTGYGGSSAEALEEVAVPDEEGDSSSVYVRNLPSTISSFDIEQEFKNFGVIKPEGVVIRNRKDTNVWYAFVEFEDAFGAQNAVKASPVQLGGRQVHIEERRPSSTSVSRGGRGRGRGRSAYPSEAGRGRFGARNYGRGSGQDGSDRDYNRPRGNGYHQRVPRQERGILGNHMSRNGQNPSDDAAYY